MVAITIGRRNVTKGNGRSPLLARFVACASSIVVLLITCLPARGVDFQFDYTHDTLGFFDDPARREVLEMAANLVNRFVDLLEAIQPSEENSWSIFPALPPGGANRFLEDETIPTNTLKIIVGGNGILPGGTLAQTSIPGPISLKGPPEWEDTINYRGQVGASQSPATDYGTWGGVTMFNADESDVPWHFGKTTEGLDPDEVAGGV